MPSCVQHQLRKAGSPPDGRGSNSIDGLCGFVLCRLIDPESTTDLEYPKAFTALRVYALSGRNQWQFWVTLILGLINPVLCTVSSHRS